MKTNETAWIVTNNDGNISILHNNKSYSIGKSHINYDRILQELKGGQFSTPRYYRLDALLNPAEQIKDKISGVTVSNGEVIWNGQPLHNAVANKIIEFMQKGLPYKPLANFINNLMQNPSNRSVEELYGFLAHKGLPITEDGHFIAYKGIKRNWKDAYSGTIDNSIGTKVPPKARNEVDDNCNNTCSRGYHVGTLQYVQGYCTERVILVKVNPKDCVSVPIDHNAQKLRVCTYEVLAEYDGPLPMTEPIYGDYTDDEIIDEILDEEDYCDDCFEYGCDGDCNDESW